MHLKSFPLLFKSLFKSSHLETRACRSRFQDCGKVSQIVRVPFESLIQKLLFWCPGLEVQIWGLWPGISDRSFSHSNPQSKAPIWRPGPSGPDLRIVARCRRSLFLLFKSSLKSSHLETQSGPDFRILAGRLRSFALPLKSLFKSFHLEIQAFGSRFEDCSQGFQIVHYPIQILIQKLAFGDPGLQVQISGFRPGVSDRSFSYLNPYSKAPIWMPSPPSQDLRIVARILNHSFSYSNPYSKAPIWRSRPSGPDSRILAGLLRLLFFV